MQGFLLQGKEAGEPQASFGVGRGQRSWDGRNDNKRQRSWLCPSSTTYGSSRSLALTPAAPTAAQTLCHIPAPHSTRHSSGTAWPKERAGWLPTG